MSKQLVSIVNPGEGDGECCAPLACEPLGEAEAAELVPLFKAIADPVRLRLLSLIACHEGGEACVCDLTAAFDLTAPTISHHLKVLKQAGLIDSERRGTWVYYWLNPGVLERLSAILRPRIAAAVS
ncbi:ArsR/SmtB family transcription factor [Actinomadura opuntiae]|uniref:ArsR/SmtB family transcription factor n=1 Tax=Actinomadura sp. OS1-43 TaxID=604315 RepID=UPI00255ACBAC|nr:metalloregulator ArsR/SmtB family transcription factor [Actinomadura sp. OS1-43]MDL4813415.1 metalloregulator ArsR/SmtB family transcription factor [Actinomadura sp. OS1-43]